MGTGYDWESARRNWLQLLGVRIQYVLSNRGSNLFSSWGDVRAPFLYWGAATIPLFQYYLHVERLVDLHCAVQCKGSQM